jgi:hypothetical protein
MSAQLEQAIKARDAGIVRVKAKNSNFVETMRSVARMIAYKRYDKIITADDLREWYGKNHNTYIDDPTHHNAWGAIFNNNDDFEFVGYTKSVQKQGHGNIIRKWRLKSA